jgi:hypothetical protein
MQLPYPEDSYRSSVGDSQRTRRETPILKSYFQPIISGDIRQQEAKIRHMPALYFKWKARCNLGSGFDSRQESKRPRLEIVKEDLRTRGEY